MADGWGTPGGGSSKSGGGGGGKTRAQKKAEKYRATPKYTEDQLVRLASRLARSPAGEKAQTLSALQDAFEGYTMKKIGKAARRANLDEGDIRTLQGFGRDHVASTTGATFLDYLDRPSQAVLGGITEGGGGAVRGFTGKEKYTPVQTFSRVALGDTEREAQKREAGLPGYVSAPANIAGSIATDPLTYLTFGVGGAAKAGARSAALKVGAGRVAATAGKSAADDILRAGVVTANPVTKSLFKDITERGLKALTRVERKALPRSLRRAVRRAPGGIRLAGHAIPGTVKAGRAIRAARAPLARHAVDDPGLLTAAERLASPRAGARQLERAGDAPLGFADDLETLASRFKGTAQSGANRGMRLAQRAMRRLSKSESDRVVASIEDPALIARLSPKEKSAFDIFDRMRSDIDVMKVTEARTLHTPEELAALGWDDALPLERRFPRFLSDEAKKLKRKDSLPPVDDPLRGGPLSGTLRGRAAETKYVPTPEIRLPGKGALDETVRTPDPAAFDRLTSGRYGGGDISAFPMPGRKDGVYITGWGIDPAERGAGGIRMGRQILEDADASHTAIYAALDAAGDPRLARFYERAGFTPVEGLPGQSIRSSPELQFIVREPRVAAVSEAARGAQRFDVNPGKAFARDYAEAARDMARVRFVDDAAKITDDTGRPFLKASFDDADLAAAKGADSAWTVQELPIRDPTGMTRTQPVLVRKEIAEDFARLSRLMTDDAALRQVKKEWHKVLGLWKSYATSPLPFGAGFSIRNAEGNFVNGFWLGNTNPVWMLRGARLQHKMARAVRQSGDALSGLSPKELGWVDEMMQEGIIDTGFFSNLDDLGREIKIGGSAARRAGRQANKANPLSQEFLLLRGGRGMNSAIENNARIGMFLGQRAKGLEPSEAARMVRKYLFDYQDLSRADRAAKNVSPFFTWIRKNTPLQLETAVRAPGKLSAQQHVLEGLRGAGIDFDPISEPEWMRENEAVVAPFDTGALGMGGDDPLAWVPDFPVTSAQETLKPLQALFDIRDPGGLEKLGAALSNAVGFGGPVGTFKALTADLAAGKDIFTGRPFYPGERVQTPSYMEPLKALGMVGDTIPRSVQYLFESGLPGATKVRGALPTDPRDKDKQIRRLFSLFTGQSLWPLTDQTKRSELFRRYDELDALRRSLLESGVKVPDSRSASKKKAGW